MLRNVVISILVASFSLGSFPTGVGAYQNFKIREDLTAARAGVALAQADMDNQFERLNESVELDLSSTGGGTSSISEIEMGGGARSEIGSADAGEPEDLTTVELEAASKESDSASLENGIASEKQEQTQGESADNANVVDEGAAQGGPTSAEEDASVIEGAEVLQQGDGETTGNVLVADRAAVDALGGRDYVGQTVKEINGTKYILIGNEQQLRAIGSDKHVVDKVWEKHVLAEPTLEYGGDADLAQGENLKNKDYGGLFGSHCGSDVNGNPDKQSDADTDLKYSSDANYIIFRDIDVGDTVWEPLMFSGTMLGAKAADTAVKGNLWERFDVSAPDGLKADTDRPVISGVKVHQTGKLDISKHQGVGFSAPFRIKSIQANLESPLARRWSKISHLTALML